MRRDELRGHHVRDHVIRPDPGQGGDAGAGLPYRALVAEIGAGAYLDDTRD